MEDFSSIFKKSYAAGGKDITINLNTSLKKSEFISYLFQITQYSHLINLKFPKLPMCLFESHFFLLDNTPCKEKIKNKECFSCKFNLHCNGFFKESEHLVKSIPDIPKEVVIEVTDNCNLNCEFCFNKYSYNLDKRQERKNLPLNVIKNIILQTKEMNVNFIRFTGGEPLLHPDFIEMVNFAKKVGFHVWLNTNGTLIDQKMGEFIKKNIDNVLISFHGNSTPELEGVKVLRGGIVLTNENIKKLEEYYKLYSDKYLLEFYRPMNVANPDLKFAIEEIFRLNLLYGKGFKIANAIPLCLNEKLTLISCGGVYDDGANRMVVSTNGKIKPSYYSPKTYGDIKSLYNAWNSEEWRQLRNLSNVPKKCEKCKLLLRCRGGSKAIAEIYGKDPLIN